MSHWTVCVACGALLVSSLLPSPARAQQDPPADESATTEAVDAEPAVDDTTNPVTIPVEDWHLPEGGSGRRLGGHDYMPVQFFPGPFVTTQVSSSTGFAVLVGLEVPVYDVEGNQVSTTDGDILFFQQKFDLQVALTDWMALGGGIAMTQRIGTSVDTLLNRGLSLLIPWELWAVFRIWNNDQFQLGVRADGGKVTATFVDVLSFVQDSVAAGQIERARLVQNATYAEVGGSVLLAYSPTPSLGLRLEVGGGALIPDDSAAWDNEARFRWGFAAELDFLELTPVPIGLSVGVTSLNIPSAQELEIKPAWSMGVFYTGRADFGVGLEALYQEVPQREGGEPVDALTVVTFVIRLAYFF